MTVSNKMDDVTGFIENVFKATLLGLLQHIFAAIGGNHNEVGRGADIGQGTNALARFDTIERRHLPIDEDDFVRLTELKTWQTISIPS